jgi:hypothetical protein
MIVTPKYNELSPAQSEVEQAINWKPAPVSSCLRLFSKTV